jgi:hypothetical protein
LTGWGPRIAGLGEGRRVRYLPFDRNYDRYFRRFVNAGFDIGVAPLPDDDFHRGKSNNKFREYAAAGVVGVYSDMPVYNACVEHQRTGLLVPNTPAAWFEALLSLTGDAAARTRMAAAANAFAREHYNAAITDREWLAAIGVLAKQVRVPRRGIADRLAPGHGASAAAPRLVRQAAALLLSSGARIAWRRAADHLYSLSQIVLWRWQRRSLPGGAH